MVAAACGDDGVHHLADAPGLPDVPVDVAIDAAIDAPANVDLTVSLAGNGGGTVTSSIGGINCGTTCADNFPPNTVVTLTAEPAVGSVFTGWMGGCTGTLPTCDVTIAQATSVTATFTLQTFTVTIGKVGVGTGAVTGSGGINCGAACTTTVDYGTMVTLTAAPLALSNFIGWGGPCSGVGMCTTTITANTTITAAFALDDISMTVTTSGNGSGTVTSAPAGITCGTDCDQIYVANTVVTLTAAPATGSTFTGWSGAGCSGTGTCVVTMTTAVLVTATFTLDKFQVDVTKAGNGTGAVTSTPAGIACGGDCNETYDYNTVVTLTAAPGAGSLFAGWSGGGCTGTTTCVVTVAAATSVTATFSLNMYLLTTTLAGTGSGTVTSTPAGIACGADCNQLYNHGTVVSLAAAPAAGSMFAGWSGACTGMGPCSVTMTAIAAVTATFTLNTYPLTVTLAGNGAGSVSSSPAGIACGADCTETYGHGTVVTLTPTAMTGTTFGGWSGACSGMGACTVTMTAMTAVTATFTLNKFTLNAAKAGNGSGTITSTPAGISCGADCTEDYNFGQMVMLAQSATTGSTFAGWSGACTGMSTCVVTMDMMRSVTATFTLNSLTLMVTTSGNGSGSVSSAPAGISCGADCTEIYNFGTIVTLSHSAATGSTFIGWTGACTGTGPCMVTMDAAKTVTATFTLNMYPLNATTAGTGMGTITSTPAGITCGIDCTEMYNHGTVVALAQAASTGSTFTGWSGACTGMGACSVTMDMMRSVTATFALDTYALNVMKLGTGTGTVTSTPAGISCGADCGETYTFGTVVTLAQTPGTGSTFNGWGGPCTGTGVCTVTMSAIRNVTATYTLKKYTLMASVTGSGTITSTPAGISCGADCMEDYDHGTVVALTQSAGTGYTFTGWGGGVCSGTGPCSVTMDMARSVTATFTINKYALDVTKTGTGTVTSTPAGISCGATCTAMFNHGTIVALTQSAGTGYTFTGWGGGVCSGTGACSVTMDMARSVTATFTLNKYALDVSVTGSGTVTSTPAGISCTTNCSAMFNHGTVVALTQSAGTGYTFAGWGGGVCSGTGPCSVTMDMARSVTATFTITSWTLDTSTPGTGSGTISSSPAGIACPGDCTQDYTYGTVVTLTQSAATGSVFTGWGGACTGTGTCTVTMDMARSVSATFTIATYKLSVSVGSSAGGTGTITSSPAGISCGANCSALYNYGTVITLTATPGTASNFIGWSGCAGAGFGPCTITLTGDTSITGTFSAPNVMFVTSKPYSGGFAANAAAGVQTYADAECQAAAQAAGLIGSTPGRNETFRAWLSSTVVGGATTNAVSKFTGSSGWVRAGDFRPVMNTPTDFASSKIWYPPRRDETGADLGAGVLTWTGTGINGLYSGSSCAGSSSWTSTSGSGTAGLPSATGSPISQFLDIGCASANRRLMCMGVGRATSVGAAPVTGKLAFTTLATWTPGANGISGADSLCSAEATSAQLPGTYQALLATTTRTAISRFSPSGTAWVRAGDRQPLTTTEAAMYSVNTSVLEVAPNVDATGNRIGNVSIYTGAPTITSLANSSGSCVDWTDPNEGKGSGGFPFDTGMQAYFFGAQNNNVSCAVARHVVCLQK